MKLYSKELEVRTLMYLQRALVVEGVGGATIPLIINGKRKALCRSDI